jgi:hypothetical protein
MQDDAERRKNAMRNAIGSIVDGWMESKYSPKVRERKGPSNIGGGNREESLELLSCRVVSCHGDCY